MSLKVKLTRRFKKESERLAKKYPSIPYDLENLLSELIENPRSGNALRSNVYKVRMKIKSKGRGKSGGARIITALFTFEDLNEIEEINLLTIYDKSEKSTITDKELDQMLKNIRR
ncbi:MAG: hypothetical protein AAGF87_09370 [Bacteroidota bacterium]